jgi:POT family proton-dependent oligopeptide transporter
MSHQSLTKEATRGIRALFLIQIFSTLSFSVLYSTLVLYATKGVHLNVSTALGITGSFVAFNFFLHLLGGYIGGRLISYRDLFCIGMGFQTLGCIIISLASVSSLYWGLAAFLTGCGLNVTCVNCMLTQLFDPHDKNRETAFLWNYSGMNIGFFIGFTMSGLFQISLNYTPLFYGAAFGNVIAFLITLVNWKTLKDVDTHYTHTSTKKKIPFFFGALFMICILTIVLRWLLDHATFSNEFILVIGLLMLLILATIAIQEKVQTARRKLWAFFVLTLASLIFWTLYQMAPMGLMLFLTNNVDRQFGSFLVPPQWFFDINTLIIIVGGPAMAYINRKMRERGHIIRIPVQFTLALFLIGIAFAILPIGIYFADGDGKTAFLWVIVSYILQSLGELFISPIGYAMVGQLIPRKLQGLMMGTWLMITGVAATLSNYFSQRTFKHVAKMSAHDTNPLFSETFNILGWSSILGGLILLILIPFLKKLIQEKSDKQHIKPHPYNAPEDTPH